MRITAHIVPALLFAGLSSAAPARKRDSSSGEEVAVSAPFGIPLSDTSELSSQLSTGFGAEPTALPVDATDSAASASTTADSASATVDSTSTTASDSSLTTTTDSSLATDSATDSGLNTISGIDTIASTGVNSVYFPPSETAAPPYVPPVVSSGSSYVPPVVSSGSGYNMPSYGSGSVSWESSYNTCVQTCMASYPPPPTVVSLPPTEAPSSYDSGSSVSSGSSTGSDSQVSSSGGQTWNIVVAPKKGVLRFVPFSVNAQPGDTLKFTWGAGPHTVTQSSAATPCNATASGFKSGSQNATFVFDQVVNSTDPIWFYCGIPTHCQKGMFGVVNPPALPGAPSSVGSMMSQWAASNPDIATALAYTQNVTSGKPGADWGANIDVSSIDPMYHAGVANSVLLTRATIAANPDMVGADGVFRPTGDVKIPEDISSTLATTDAYGAANDASASSSGSASSTASSTSAPGSPSTASSSAGSVASSSFAAAGAAILAALMML